MAQQTPSRKFDIGLDLTSNELRCVALSRKGKEITLERFALGVIPSSVFAAGRVAEPAELGAKIRQILHEAGITARRAIISLSGKAAITRIIELPKMGAAQTRQAISLQINQYVPFPPGDTVYDYKILPPREGGNVSMQEVLLVATRSSTVDSLIATLRSAGIECDGIKITSLAAWNVLEPGLQGYSQAVGIIDMRDTVTDLSFFLNGQFRLSRPVELGYTNIMAKVAQLLGVTPGEAEEYLKADPVDLTIPEDEIDPTEDNRMREALLSVFSGFVSELIRSIRYYESQAQRSERVGKLLLFGNMRLFPNVAKYLEDQTGLEVGTVNLGTLVQYRQGVYSLDFLHESASKLIVSAGLALELFKRKKELNLMPPAYYTRSVNATIVKFAILVFAVLGALGWYYNETQSKLIADMQGDLDQLKRKEAELKPDADKFDTRRGEIQAELPRFNQIFNLVSQQIVWPEIMTELGNRTNDQVWLESVDFEGNNKSIKMNGKGVTRVDIFQFAINIDKSPYFTNTNIEEKKTSGTGGGGGAGGGGGGGGAAARMGGAFSSGPPARSSIIGGPMGAGEVSPMQDYKLPRFSFQAGASIEDFFRLRYIVVEPGPWEFELKTDFQAETVDPPEVAKELTQIKEVIDSVLKT
jgi:type IV pilus assembly protein PilM